MPDVCFLFQDSQRGEVVFRLLEACLRAIPDFVAGLGFTDDAAERTGEMRLIAHSAAQGNLAE